MYIPSGLHEMSLLPPSTNAPAAVNNGGAEPSGSNLAVLGTSASGGHHTSPQLHLSQPLQERSHYSPYDHTQHVHRNLNLQQPPEFNIHHPQIQPGEFDKQPQQPREEFKHFEQNHSFYGSFPISVLFADASHESQKNQSDNKLQNQFHRNPQLQQHQTQHHGRQQQPQPLASAAIVHPAQDADMPSPNNNLGQPITYQQPQLQQQQRHQYQQEEGVTNATSMQASGTANDSMDDSKEGTKDDDKMRTSQGDEELVGVDQKAFASPTSTSNRWPRQETLALLEIRSDMDTMFRDSSPKGPLWEMVSRRLAEMGFSRSAKKCKEKFENVHKYYKRTREERILRQGTGGISGSGKKNYRFFSQLEALYARKYNTTAPAAVLAAPRLITSNSSSNESLLGNNAISVHVTTATLEALPLNHSVAITNVEASLKSNNKGQFCPPQLQLFLPSLHPQPYAQPVAAAAPADLQNHMLASQQEALNMPQNHMLASQQEALNMPQRCKSHVSNCELNASDSSSSDATTSCGLDLGSDEEDAKCDAEKKHVTQRSAPRVATSRPLSQTNGTKRKRKHDTASMKKYAQLFDGMVQKVFRKQEQIQQRFLEALERRDQDRIAREEAWRRQEMARVNREQDRRAQEHALSAARDAAFIAFLQKLSGHRLALHQPAPLMMTSFTPDPIPVAPPPPPSAVPIPVTSTVPMSVASSMNVSMVFDDHDKDLFYDPSSKRWPKPEVLTLIKLRIGLEHKFHEPGSKAVLWEEISKTMSLHGYNRAAKRCKEKWENINKYFKKAKESKRLRPENAKTCPYFNQLDALYRGGVLGSLGDKPIQLLLIHKPEDEMQQQANESHTGGGDDSGQAQQGDLLDAQSDSADNDTCGGISSNGSPVHLLPRDQAANSDAPAPVGVDSTSKVPISTASSVPIPAASSVAAPSLITLETKSSVKSSGSVADHRGIQPVALPVEQVAGQPTTV